MTVSQADFDKLLARVAELEANQGDYSIAPLAGSNNVDRPNGEATVVKSLRQLHEFADALENPDGTGRLDEVRKQVAALLGNPSSVEPLPIPSGMTADAVDVPGFGNGMHLKSGAFEALIFISDYDYAMRILTNHKANADGGHTYAIETLPQQRIDIEQFGITMGYFKPRKYRDADGTLKDLTPNDYDKMGGKGIIFRPGGQDENGRRGRYAQIFGGVKGMGLQIGVAANSVNYLDNPTIQIEPDGTRTK